MAQSLSLIEKINNIGVTTTHTKGYSNALWGGAMQSFYASQTDRDFGGHDYGIAQASQVIVDISSALTVWGEWLDGVKWLIKDGNTGTTLADTTMRQYPQQEKGGRVFNAIKRYRENFKHSYWKSLALSDWVIGETYILRAGNGMVVSDLQWLNPLYTEPMEINGFIQYYNYNADDAQTVGWQIPPQHIAYRMMRRNIFNDLRGYSSLLSVIDESNLSRNVKRAFRKYFQNGMILGGVISPKGDIHWNTREMQGVERDLTQNNHGLKNAHNWMVAPTEVNAQPFTQADTEKNLESLEILSRYIATATGVPRILYGDPTDATYENLKEARKGWHEMRAIPYARDIATFHNNQILPYLEPQADVYLEPETTEYEVEEPEVVSQDVTAGYISIATAQKKRGYAVDNDLNTIYLIGNRPITKEKLLQWADTLPAQEVEQRASAEESLANAEAKPVEAQAQVADAETRLALPESEDAPVEDDEADVEQDTPEKSVSIAHGDHEHRVPVETKAHSHEDCINELKAWKKFHKNDSTRNFIPDALRGDVADSLRLAIDNDADIEAAFDSAFETVRGWQKAIQSTRLDFENDFEDLLNRAREEGNNFGRVQWASAVRSIIRRYGRQAYTDGLVAGGVLDGTLSEEDENTVADIYAEQSQYVTNLGAQIFRTDEGISAELANQKPAMWYRKSIAPFFDAGRVSADANGMYEFGGPDGRESCSTCIRLKGQRHRLKTWARKALRPGVDTDNFDCGGWQCEHKLIAVNAKARGNF